MGPAGASHQMVNFEEYFREFRKESNRKMRQVRLPQQAGWLAGGRAGCTGGLVTEDARRRR